MKKYIAGIVAGAVLALGGVAAADCVTCEDYDVKLSVNGNPYFGKWAIVDDRPYVAVEAFANALDMPSKHYYKGWSLGKKPSKNIDPLELLTLAESKKVKTIRFGGNAMVDLFGAANALGLDIHHNFTNSTIQVGDNYKGQMNKGKTYRYLSRARGWVTPDTQHRVYNKHMQEVNYMHWRGRRL